MPTETEDSKNNQYIFKYNNEAFSQTITYMKNVVEEIQKHPKSKSSLPIQEFSSKSVTEQRFSEFVRLAKDAGYTILSLIHI